MPVRLRKKASLEPPADGRHDNCGRPVSASLHVQGFLGFAYEHLAEPMANADPDQVAEGSAEGVADPEPIPDGTETRSLAEWLYG